MPAPPPLRRTGRCRTHLGNRSEPSPFLAPFSIAAAGRAGIARARPIGRMPTPCPSAPPARPAESPARSRPASPRRARARMCARSLARALTARLHGRSRHAVTENVCRPLPRRPRSRAPGAAVAWSGAAGPELLARVRGTTELRLGPETRKAVRVPPKRTMDGRQPEGAPERGPRRAGRGVPRVRRERAWSARRRILRRMAALVRNYGR